MITAHDDALLNEMATSNSRNTALTFEALSLKLGHALSVRAIRKGLTGKELWRKLLSIYTLPEKGDREDVIELKRLLKSRASKKLKMAATKSLVRFAMRLGDIDLFEESLNSSSKLEVEATLEAINKPSEVIDIGNLFKRYNSHPLLVSKAIYDAATYSDIPELKEILSEISLEPSAPDLVLALCKLVFCPTIKFAQLWPESGSLS